ncbi:MAG: Rieske 2Fe-2S domain-containing protein [Burkholderiales bacterium]|nr:Rieske 2Fe-2S domain-containing protein [Burkholderiales bacterium]
MSDALNYLVKVRPDAIPHYFKFLKESGKHLDPKTRSLISVITKVHSQTENGLRQYLLRALRDGASAMEVLDAIMMAFPALGLAKIVWAVDVILALDLPEFHPENIGKAARWHDIAATAQLDDGAATRLDCDGRGLFVYRKGSAYSVYDSRCPHQVTNIPHLAIEGLELTCPKHNWVFDLTTGACVKKGTQPLKRFEAKVEKGRLLAYW